MYWSVTTNYVYLRGERGGEVEGWERVAVEVSVLQASFAYVVELGLTTQGDGGKSVVRHYALGEAREVASQLRTPGESTLAERLGMGDAEWLADQLDVASNYASIRSIGEVVGDDVITAYKEGKITEKEFMDEFHTQTERQLKQRDT